MSTNYKTATKSDIKFELGTDSSLMKLPIMKHLDVGELRDGNGELKPGAKMIFHFLALVTGLMALYGFGVYAAPIIFVAIGKMLAIVACLGIGMFLFMARRPIVMLLEGMSRNIHKFAVRSDPFRILDKAREGQIENRTNFHIAKGKISGLKSQAETDATESESAAKKYQHNIKQALDKATEIRDARAKLLSEGGTKDTDEYVELDRQWMVAVSNGERLKNKYEQAKEHTIKYGARAAVMGKLDRRLVLVGTSIDIKIDDFDATVEILKKESKFAAAAKNATETAKDAILFTTGWELDYAIEVVTESIINDIATTASNLRDINDFTGKYGVDSDDLYANLERTYENIRIGDDKVVSANKYKNPDYVFTTEDKKDMKGMETIDF